MFFLKITVDLLMELFFLRFLLYFWKKITRNEK